MTIKRPSAKTDPAVATVSVGPAGIVTAPVPPASREKGANSLVANALRNVVLGAFLLYCLLPAVWIITAMSKDIGQLFLTFVLWFASPPHFFENLVGLITSANGF